MFNIADTIFQVIRAVYLEVAQKVIFFVIQTQRRYLHSAKKGQKKDIKANGWSTPKIS